MGQRVAAEFKGRKGLHRKVDFRPGLRVYYGGIVAFQMLLLALAAYFILSMVLHGTGYSQIIYPIAVILMILTNPTRDVFRVFLGPYLTTAVTIKPDGILIHDHSGEKEISYAEINRVEIPTGYSFLTDISLYFNNGKKISFPRWLERCDYILDTLKSFKPELIDQKKFEEFRIKVIDFDHVMARAVTRMNVKRMTLLYIATPIILFLLGEGLRAANVFPPIYESGTKLFLFNIQILFSVASAGIIMTFEEMMIRKKFLNQIQNDPLAVRRDLVYEQKMMSLGNKAVLLAALFVWVTIFLIKTAAVSTLG